MLSTRCVAPVPQALSGEARIRRALARQRLPDIEHRTHALGERMDWMNEWHPPTYRFRGYLAKGAWHLVKRMNEQTDGVCDY